MTPETKPSPHPGQRTMEAKPLSSSRVSRRTANSLVSHWSPAAWALPGWTEAEVTRAWCLEALLEKQPYQASCHLQEGQTPTCEHPAVGVPGELLFQPGLQTSGPWQQGPPAQPRIGCSPRQPPQQNPSGRLSECPEGRPLSGAPTAQPEPLITTHESLEGAVWQQWQI